MATTKKTRSARKSSTKANGKVKRDKAAVKRSNKSARKATKSNGKANGKVRKTTKGRKAHKGGGRALSDFGNDAKMRVLKLKDIPARAKCFKTGATVSACLAAQKNAGFRGRRKFIRTQIAAGRVTLK